MKEIARLGGLLMLVTVIAATGLAGVYSVTKPRIEAQKALELERALTIALPGYDREQIDAKTRDDEVLYYAAAPAPGQKATAYCFVSEGAGYSGIIETMVGIDSSGTILGMKILSQTETPGLGTKIEEIRYGESDPWFQRQFIGRQAGLLSVDKDGGEIQSITGATISSRTVTRSIVERYHGLKEVLQGSR